MLGKKTNSRSVIWNCFGLKLDENRHIRKYLLDKPVCRTCRRSVLQRMGIPTTCFSQKRGKARLDLLVGKKRILLSLLWLAQSMDHLGQYLLNSSQPQEINKAVGHFLATGIHPISTVDEAGFHSLMYKLNPRYNCPSRKHFSEKELPQLYANVRDTKIKPQL